MSRTIVGVGDPKAVRRWSGKLAVDTNKASYFERKFTSTGANTPIQRKTDLEQDAGDEITYDLSVQLREPGVRGDNRAEGTQENLRFFTDTVKIDQLRKPISAGGKMTRKRTLHNLRSVALARGKDWWGKVFDELHFMYLSGARGHNPDFIEPLDFNGHAGNAFKSPDSAHQMYGGQARSKASLTEQDQMSKDVIEKAAVRADSIKLVDAESTNMQPIMIDGEKHFVIVMSPFQMHDLRQGVDWLDIQKALMTYEGNKNPVCRGGAGMINNVVLHKHDSVITWQDGGAGKKLPVARAVMLGAQAGVIAYGSGDGQTRMEWGEELLDLGNEAVISTGSIFGIKKSQFNQRDFGVIAIDTVSANPSPL